MSAHSKISRAPDKCQTWKHRFNKLKGHQEEKCKETKRQYAQTQAHCIETFEHLKKRGGGCEGKKLLQTSWESQKPKIKGWHLKSAQMGKKKITVYNNVTSDYFK